MKTKSTISPEKELRFLLASQLYGSDLEDTRTALLDYWIDRHKAYLKTNQVTVPSGLLEDLSTSTQTWLLAATTTQPNIKVDMGKLIEYFELHDRPLKESLAFIKKYFPTLQGSLKREAQNTFLEFLNSTNASTNEIGETIDVLVEAWYQDPKQRAYFLGELSPAHLKVYSMHSNATLDFTSSMDKFDAAVKKLKNPTKSTAKEVASLLKSIPASDWIYINNDRLQGFTYRMWGPGSSLFLGIMKELEDAPHVVKKIKPDVDDLQYRGTSGKWTENLLNWVKQNYSSAQIDTMVHNLLNRTLCEALENGVTSAVSDLKKLSKNILLLQKVGMSIDATAKLEYQNVADLISCFSKKTLSNQNLVQHLEEAFAASPSFAGAVVAFYQSGGLTPPKLATRDFIIKNIPKKPSFYETQEKKMWENFLVAHSKITLLSQVSQKGQKANSKRKM